MDDPRTRPIRWTLLIAAAASLGTLVSCGPPEEQAKAAPAPAPTTVSPSAAVLPQGLEARVRHYWDAAIRDDWKTLYEYRDPRDRDKATLEQFTSWSTQNEPFEYASYELVEILEEPGIAWAHLMLQASMRNFPGTPTREVERWHVWRTVQDRWYPVPILEMASYPETPAIRNTSEEPRLRDRFDASWKLRQANDWTPFYQMGDPRDHAAVPFDQFAAAYAKSTYLDAEVFWTEVIGDRGRVRLRFSHKVNDPSLSKLPPKIVIAFEEWVLVDGEWYLDLVNKGPSKQ